MTDASREIENVSAHLNHNTVSAIASLATKLRFLAEDIAAIDKGRDAIQRQEKAYAVLSLNYTVIGIARRLQEFRASVVSGDLVTEEELQDLLRGSIEILSETAAEIREFSRAPVLLKFKDDVDRCRRKANHAERLLRHLYNNQTDVELASLPLGVENIISIAFENACESVSKTYSFHEMVAVRDKSELSGKLFHGDYDRLIEVFTNLFENSFKYSEKQSATKISIEIYTMEADPSVARGKDLTLSIEFKDNGQGVPPNEVGEIFKKGARGARWKDKSSGLGYGLYYAKKVLAAHRGDIIYRRGAFVISLPVYFSVDQFNSAVHQDRS